MQLKAQGINDRWNTLRQTLAIQRRVTVTVTLQRHPTRGTILKLDPNPGRSHRVRV